MEVAQDCWLEKKVKGCQYLVAIMVRVESKQPQTVYMGLQNSLQQEWGFLKGVTPDIGTAFQPIEDELLEAFLLSLLKGATY